MSRITEAEFDQIVKGIIEDKEAIIRHNPIGTREEILLWMLLSCLISYLLLNCLVNYLSLNEQETPCFKGRPDASTYRQAIESVLHDRRVEQFDIAAALDELLEE